MEEWLIFHGMPLIPIEVWQQVRLKLR